MATKKANGSVQTHDDRRTSVDRDEYAALVALKDLYDGLVAENAKAANRNHDLLITCNAQARRLSEVDLIVQHYERVVGLQRVFIDTLRAGSPQVAALEDLSKFWQHWTSTTENHLSKQPQRRDEVAKLEPDLFRSWRLWIKDAGKVSRLFSVAGTRAEVDAQQLIPQATLQDHILDQMKSKTKALTVRVRELEAELDAYKNGKERG